MKLICEQLDDTIRARVESKLIEPYAGMSVYPASSLLANVIMYHVSEILCTFYTTT